MVGSMETSNLSSGRLSLETAGHVSISDHLAVVSFIDLFGFNIILHLEGILLSASLI